MGSVAGSGGTTDIVLNDGQTYHINGWTIRPDDHRTGFTDDDSGHGMLVNVQDIRGF